MPFAVRDNTRLYWRLEGGPDKPAMVLIHELGTDLGLWDQVVVHLRGRFRVLRLDVRGHGASDGTSGDYTLANLTADAICVMNAAAINEAAICGLGLGAAIAVELALAEPGRVCALALAAPWVDIDRAAWDGRAKRVREAGMAAEADDLANGAAAGKVGRGRAELLATVRQMAAGTTEDGYLGCCAAIRDGAIENRVDTVTVPVLVVTGRDDAAAPTGDWGEPTAKAHPNVVLRSLPTGHFACVEAPSLFAGVVADFFANRATDPESAGMTVRRQSLGDDWVDGQIARTTAFNAEFMSFVTRCAWGETWTREGLDFRTRRLLALTSTAAQARWFEFRLHARAGLEQGDVSPDDLNEMLLQLAVYAGVPAAATGFLEVGAILNAAEPPSATG